MPIHYENRRLIIIRGNPRERAVNDEINRHLDNDYSLRGITKEGEETFYFLTRTR